MLRLVDVNGKQGNISNVEGVERSKVTLERSTIYFSQILLYSENSRKLIKRMIDDIEEFVRNETKMNTVSISYFLFLMSNYRENILLFFKFKIQYEIM